MEKKLGKKDEKKIPQISVLRSSARPQADGELKNTVAATVGFLAEKKSTVAALVLINDKKFWSQRALEYWYYLDKVLFACIVQDVDYQDLDS